MSSQRSHKHGSTNTGPSSAHKTPSPASSEFPHLRNFLRGYFHQDMKDEYASAQNATREFCKAASPEDRGAVASEWAQFLQLMRDQPLQQLNRVLTEKLGSSYSITAKDIEEITGLLGGATNSS